MKSLWARYNEELNGPTFIEREWGFISYAKGIDCIAVHDVFIAPEHRNQGLRLFKSLVSEVEGVARKAEKAYLTGQVILNINDSKKSAKTLKLHLGIGFEPYAVGLSNEGHHVLYLRREVEYGRNI